MYWDEVAYTGHDIHDSTTKTGETVISTQGDYVTGSITGIYAYEMYDNFYARAYNGAGELSRTYGLSVASNMTQMIDYYGSKTDAQSQALVQLCKAMLIYGNNAKNNPVVNKGN